MAIQDLINEVNSIQTKKQAIKEAITAKGVTSEGKLSKFADEIKKITTKEPDWYIVSKFRYDNGNEALLVRTSDKNAVNADKYQMVEIGGGVTRDNSISNSFNINYNNDFGITNGNYFPRETAYRSFTTKDDSNIVFDGHNDNLKLRLRDGKDIVFNDVNVYNWLKGYRNQPLADFNTLYLKSDGINNTGAAKTLKDFLASSLETKTITLDSYGTNPIILIDSSIMIQAMNFKTMSNIGFIYFSDKTVEAASLEPIFYTNNNNTHAPFYENKEQLYGNLSPGNYIHLYKTDYFLAVFVSVNFVIDNNGQKHKNIEVYIYKITRVDGSNIDISRIADKPFELYLTFSSRAQRQLQQASTPKVFRRQVLAANGTPEPNATKFLNGQDALLIVSAAKNMMDKKPTNINTFNVFRRSNMMFSAKNLVVRYSNSGSTAFNGSIISKTLTDDIAYNNKIVGFIRLNDDSNTIFPIELEKATDEIINNNTNINTYKNNYQLACIAPNGIPNKNNKTVVFVSGSKYGDNIQAFYIKKGTAYITNDWLSTVNKNTYLYLTSDTQTQAYLNSKPLSDIWTEIQDVSAHSEEYDAYNEE